MKQLAAIGFLTISLLARAAAAEPTLDLKELMEVLRANLPGLDEQELTQAAARGLIAQLRPRVTLLADEASTNSTASTNLAAPRTTTFEKAYAYLRPGEMSAGADKQFADALAAVTRTNRLKGLMLDLRFSGGENYAAAAGIADKFSAGEEPLIDYGEGLRKSTPNDDAVNVPVAILVNAKTVGASEALAGILRHNDVGLLIGSTTGGQAHIAKTVTLSTGQKLRIATTPVKTGNGHPLPASGLKPDIVVDVSPDEEYGHVEDVYLASPKFVADPAVTNQAVATASTNRSRRRINEAELVRMLRDGQSPDGETSNGPRRATPPMLQDPVLARALDLLKGLAVLQQARTVGSPNR